MNLEVESAPDVEKKEIDLRGVDLRKAGKLFDTVGSRSRQDWSSMGGYFNVANELDLQMEVLSPELQLAFFQFMRGTLQPGELMRELDEERKRLSLPKKLIGNEMSTIRTLVEKGRAIEGASPFAPLANEDHVSLAMDHLQIVAFQLGRLHGLCDMGAYGRIKPNPVGFGPAKIRADIKDQLGLPALKAFDTFFAGTGLV